MAGGAGSRLSPLSRSRLPPRYCHRLRASLRALWDPRGDA
ncbi:MAG TPA: hypothetical protein DEP84_12110 [Chloroflexi bacterium]|nr:hypothetical protein [Chloroflexota bacterium]